MTCILHDGPLYMRGGMDTEGYRNYVIGFLVESDSGRDGPANVMQTPGLPLPGSMWLVDDDIDIWAWCTWEREVKEKAPLEEGERWHWWVIELKFTTRPPGLRRFPGRGLNHGDPSENKRSGCRDFRFEDPLTEPQKLGGAFVPQLVEATKDRFDNNMVLPSHEQIQGPLAEFDESHFSIRIEQNVSLLQINLVEALRDHVNENPLWGFNKRCVKFKNFTWERHYYGSCYKYYVRTLDFEINSKGWDRDVSNFSSLVLRGAWSNNASGSGAEIAIDAVDSLGAVTQAHVVTAGSNYPKSAYVPLALTGGLGKEAVVCGKSDANGTITGLAPNDPDGNSQKILWPGTGYAATAAPLPTAAGVRWVLKPSMNFLGLIKLPRQENPSDFIQYTDAYGNAAKAPLNKAGVPMLPDEPETSGQTHIEKYEEADLLLLGIPPDLET